MKYGQYVTLIKQIQATNVIAQANLDAQGKTKDAEVERQVKAAGKYYIDQIKAMGMTFISNVHTEFVIEGTVTPLGKVFARVKYLDLQLITQERRQELRRSAQGTRILHDEGPSLRAMMKP